MRLLAVDTATEVCTVALSEEDRLRVELSVAHGQTHAQSLMHGIRDVLALAHWGLAQIDAFVVTRGPGSFTGLRIGISTIKGLAVALDKPLVGISTLAVLAHQALRGSALICPMLDARRGETYWALYKSLAAGLEPQLPEQVGTAGEAAERIGRACLFIGNGAERYAAQLRARLNDEAHFAPPELNQPRGAAMARLGWWQLRGGHIEDVCLFKPTYLRRSDAERSQELSAMQSSPE